MSGSKRSKRSARLPAAMIWFIVLAATAVGALFVVQILQDRPKEQATVAGLFVRLDRAEWLLDQMNHGDRYPMPQSMMPDLPPHGVFRLNVEVSLHNPGDEVRRFTPTEIFFRSSDRGMWPATGGELKEVNLAPKQALNMFTYFDVSENEIRGDLRLLWVRDGRTVPMLSIPHPPEHDHEEERVVWPTDASLMAAGDPVAGEELFHALYACGSCHGNPKIPDSNTVGPHLGNIGAIAATRQPGKSAAQYIYESIISPDAFIAPECKNRPCDDPSAMPPFGDLVRLEHMPDLLAFLLEQRTDEPL